MKVLVVGGGGREHALVWKISKSPLVKEVIVAPGNAGMAPLARCEAVSADDLERQVALALENKVDLVVVGPELPLVNGLADRLRAEGIRVFGPSAAASRLEGSKVFSKEFMARHDIPTATFSVHDRLDEAVAEVERRQGYCVIKADGLAAGKGVIVSQNAFEGRQAVRDILKDRRFGDAGKRVIIEDRLEGEEVSVLAICDGERIVPLVAAQDHKAAFEGDTGPNTGGMGAYAPAPVVTSKMRDVIVEKVLKRTVRGMAAENMPFKGVLYAGLMICGTDPYVLEYNVRFGDPECQPLMMLMDEDIVPVLIAAAEGNLEERDLIWNQGATLCVVLAADGYPGSYEKGKPIEGLEQAASNPSVEVFHAGTKLNSDQFVTAGGRVLGVTALADDITTAAREAYAVANEIRWDGVRMRRDIGHRAL
ncbi:MAG: phosphoribosylamine--glycine ligase [Deltaproteobacteria bacterium]|nr:phosphoribosylamine--glycine ligase [Deltaproteobacteria bacterium]